MQSSPLRTSLRSWLSFASWWYMRRRATFLLVTFASVLASVAYLFLFAGLPAHSIGISHHLRLFPNSNSWVHDGWRRLLSAGRQCTIDYPQRAFASLWEMGPGCSGIAERVLWPFNTLDGGFRRKADFAPSTADLSQIRVLFVLSKTLFDGMTDSYFMEQLEACDRHVQMECILWGPGFSLFNDSITLEANIEVKYGSSDYFQIHFFQPGHWPVKLASLDPPPGVIRAQRFNEDWASYNAKIWQTLRAQIVMFSFAQDMFEGAARFSDVDLQLHPRMNSSVFVHAPMGVDQSVYDAGDGIRSTPMDALLVGAQGASCYPMRARIGKMIQQGVLPGKVRNHPGYILPSLEHRIAQRVEYAEELRSARIVYVTASHYRYRLQKFSEAALSGALLVGTISQEQEELFRDIVVELREDDTDEYIAAIVQWWLDHEDERRAVARLGQLVARRIFTWDATFADRLYGAYTRLVRKEYGWWFAEAFTVRTPRRNVCDCNERSSESAYVLGPRCPHVPAHFGQ